MKYCDGRAGRERKRMRERKRQREEATCLIPNDELIVTFVESDEFASGVKVMEREWRVALPICGE